MVPESEPNPETVTEKIPFNKVPAPFQVISRVISSASFSMEVPWYVT